VTELRTTAAARADIADIRRYSKSRFGAAIALGYLRGLSAMFDQLAERPLIGVSEEQLGADMRSLGFRSHRIYYQLVDGGVPVVRILHQSRDLAATMDAGE
jgi:toxin ParE1/3/4